MSYSARCIGHLHSNGDFCLERMPTPPKEVGWPVNLIDAAEADARLEVAQRDFAALQRAIVGDTAASAILTVEKMRARLEVAQRMADALRQINEWGCYATEEDTAARLVALQEIGVRARAALAEWEKQQ